MLYGYGTRDMERENDPQFVTEVPHQRERHADTMLVTVVNDESENFERLLAIVEHIATDGAEITPELVAEAREVIRITFRKRREVTITDTSELMKEHP